MDGDVIRKLAASVLAQAVDDAASASPRFRFPARQWLKHDVEDVEFWCQRLDLDTERFRSRALALPRRTAPRKNGNGHGFHEVAVQDSTDEVGFKSPGSEVGSFAARLTDEDTQMDPADLTSYSELTPARSIACLVSPSHDGKESAMKKKPAATTPTPNGSKRKQTAKPAPAAVPVPAKTVTPESTNGKTKKTPQPETPPAMKTAAKEKKPAKPASPWMTYRQTNGPIPRAADLTLTGITTSERNRYAWLHFSTPTGPFNFPLDPVGARATADVLRLRDLLVEYFAAVLPVKKGATR